LEKTYTINSKDALLITDVQKDFLPKGAMAVPNGEEVIPILNVIAKKFKDANASVFASRDWHPVNHISFKAQGGLWPPHCVQNTKGAEFNPDLKLPGGSIVISKATLPTKEAYSVFDGTTFAEELKRAGIQRLFVGGLATDYCVVNTVLDARKLGFATVVLIDAIRGINVNVGDVDRALEAMAKSGAEQAYSTSFPESVDALSLDEVAVDLLENKPSARIADKKKARMRPRGSSKQVRTEK
jgi:nicotinamidase/pyrazinamidase